MADFEIIEADFQQYYNLDVSQLKFRRYARLLINLPPNSRFFMKHLESKDWDWDKEVQSRMLYALNSISCQIANMVRKKGAKAIKPPEQFQPDYVKEAKKNAEREKKMVAKEDMEDLKEIFEARNNLTKKLEV